MATQLIPSVKGTRDFYPEDFAFRNWLYGKMKKVSQKFGYREYDGPEIEYLDLYTEKTSQEILQEQVFTLKDRDNRLLALRPELTPTFARMVAQRAQQLPSIIRWFMFGRAWRYEQPQRGRGREFFQWEINILGPETAEADAEIIAIAVEFFKEIGITSHEVVIRINDRSYFEQILKENNIPQNQFMPLLRIIDRKEKVTPEEFVSLLKEQNLNDEQVNALNTYLSSSDYSNSPWLSRLFKNLQAYEGVLDYVVYDPTIARGFDYYTRTVFEAWDKTGQLRRALFGGGRFDNLTATLGGERIPGVGMAPGDMPIRIILEQFNKMPQLELMSAQVLVSVFSEELAMNSVEISSILRSKDIETELWVDTETKLDKQLKYADTKGIPYVIIIGPDEAAKNQITLKDLKNRTQQILSVREVIQKLKDD